MDRKQAIEAVKRAGPKFGLPDEIAERIVDAILPQPVVVTDEMVRAGRTAAEATGRVAGESNEHYAEAVMRAALEAALSVPPVVGRD